MPKVDQIAAASGLSAVLTRQQAKQAGLVKEAAVVERQTLASVHRSRAFAAELLLRSEQALSSVTETLNRALAIAAEARESPEANLAGTYNRELDKTEEDTTAASVQGHNLISAEAKSISVETTHEGGKLILQAAPSDAKSLGISRAGDWSSQTRIEQSISQIQMALAQIASTRAKYAVLKGALNAALQLNGASKGEVSGKESLAEVELSTYVGEEQGLHHARNILGLLEK